MVCVSRLLAEIELLMGLLQVAGGDVVEHAPAEDIALRLLSAHLHGVAPKDDGQLGFIVQPLHYIKMPVDIVPGANDPGGTLGKIYGLAGVLHEIVLAPALGLHAVVAVVHAQADDVLARLGDGREELHVLQRHALAAHQLRPRQLAAEGVYERVHVLRGFPDVHAVGDGGEAPALIFTGQQFHIRHLISEISARR